MSTCKQHFHPSPKFSFPTGLNKKMIKNWAALKSLQDQNNSNTENSFAPLAEQKTLPLHKKTRGRYTSQTNRQRQTRMAFAVHQFRTILNS